MKGTQSKPNPSPNAFPNYGTRACKKRRGTRTVFSLRGKSSGIMNGNYPLIIWELSLRIMRKRERERERERERQTDRETESQRGKTRTVPSFRGKSSGIMSGNYPLIIWELLLRNIT